MYSILFVYSSPINPNNGGVQKVTYNLAKQFKAKGNNVYFLSVEKYDTLNCENFEYFSLPEDKVINSMDNLSFLINIIYEKKIHIVINQSGMDIQISKLCLKVKKNTDAIFISVFHNSILGGINNFNFNKPLFNKIKLATFLNLLYKRSHLFKRIILFFYWLKYQQHYERIVNRSDTSVLLSDSYLKELKFFIKNINSNKIISISNPVIITNGIDKKQKKNQLLFVGRVDIFQKQINILLNIWERLYNVYPEWNLLIVGNGPDKLFLQSIVKSQAIPRVKFLNAQNPDKFYKESKIFCLTSSFEGWPLVIHEAQMNGVVPILFNSFLSAANMVNNNIDAIIVNSFSIDSYVEKISNLMEDENQYNFLFNNCFINAKKFDIENICNIWINQFDILTKERKIVKN
jgi:glycosyltransferase involved in cell wall biosynthesis